MWGVSLRIGAGVGARIAPRIAQVAELVDALASGASDRKIVEVRVFSWAPFFVFGLFWRDGEICALHILFKCIRFIMYLSHFVI